MISNSVPLKTLGSNIKTLSFRIYSKYQQQDKIEGYL